LFISDKKIARKSERKQENREMVFRDYIQGPLQSPPQKGNL
jgi:hypothetical protein